MAAHLGIAFQQVQTDENGANRISASMLARAAPAPSCSAADIMGEAPGAGLTAEALEMARVFKALPSARERRVRLERARTMLRKA